MARRRSVDLLPEIFRTETNKKFLAATLDQLTQEPQVKKTQGYVGRRVGPGIDPADRYVVEPTRTRTDYQLEPGVVFLKPDTNTVEDAITYPGMIDALDLQGAATAKQDRLWQSEYYTWDPFCDLDKLVNYSQYYWLPQGPNSVDVFSSAVPSSDSWTISRVDTPEEQYYAFSDVGGKNPTITLMRGGTYEFKVNQLGHQFWIQKYPGINGKDPASKNISSRDVMGVINNGEDVGTLKFTVPLKNAQDFYLNLPVLKYNNQPFPMDLVATDIGIADLNNVYVRDFLARFPNGIDGITNLNGRTVIFTNKLSDAEVGGWILKSQFDPLLEVESNDGLSGSYDTVLFDQQTTIDTPATRYSVWRIQYIEQTPGDPYMRLSSVLEVPQLTQFTVGFGTKWANTQWYKNAEGYFEKRPLITAPESTLYYQDSTNPNFVGQIRLVDPQEEQPLDLNDIIGARDYTSPNGVVLTNGLKIQIRGAVDPPQFQNIEFYVEGVGTGPGIAKRVGFIDGEAYFGPWHTYQGQKMTGWVHDTTVFQQYIYDTVSESLANLNAGGPAGAPLPNTGVLGAENGNGIRLIPVSDFVTPETYTKSVTVPYDSTGYDVAPYDSDLNSPAIPDYITINRAARDRNAWTRSNRWFHIDVINATAQYNNTVAVLDNDRRGKRPIVEFRAGLELYNYGTQGKTPVDIIDLGATDAFSNIAGQLGYGVDGYEFIEGSRVIFARDRDAQVRNRIYRVEFIIPDTVPPEIPQPVINLVPEPDGEALIDQTVLCLSGNTLQGQSFWFDGVEWQKAQQKTSVNQAPLFDVRDIDGVSYGDRARYPSSTFAGSRLFGYAVSGTATSDAILGFALKYLNIENVGDIVFENYLYTDRFVTVRNNASETIVISNGFVRQYYDRTGFSDLIGWQTAAAESRSRQVFRFTYTEEPLVLDVAPAPDTTYPVVQIFIEGRFQDPTTYTLSSDAVSTTVEFVVAPATDSVIEVEIISDQASSTAYYQVPLNLESNPLNQDSDVFTLGTIRNHYNSIGQNLKLLQGTINGANNTRDLGNILRYGDLIIQNSSPIALTGVFLRKQQYEVFNALRFNSQEYEKYKNLLLDLATRGDFVNTTPTEILDQVLLEIAAGKNQFTPFYWSDMIPSGETYTEVSYTYSAISDPVFDLNRVYDFTSSNFQGLLVYVNGTLLIKGYDYTVGVNSPTVTIVTPLAPGDVVTIREYSATYGSFVPNTPTKMGLYPAFKPQIYLEQTTNGSVAVIQGHDGSITRAFGDARDAVLLEFETRIYDNLKIATPVPMVQEEVIPGQFRKTNYSLAEINSMLITDFLSWVGWNKIDYASQAYQPDNQFSYNYRQSGNRLTEEPLLGAWRGIYEYFYDTYYPTTRPWEMLGFSEEPAWWQNEYGPAPYTSGNMVLWEDLEAGIVRDPIEPYVNPLYRRPGLTRVIPADSEGRLLSPLDAVTGNYDGTSFRRSWVFGDGGPAESAWRGSSAWPFAVMRLLALTKPAKFFSLFVDRDRYVFDDAIGQYLWDGRYRIDAKDLEPVYGAGTSKASYLNWIIDYNRQGGRDSTEDLTIALANIGVRLCWRLAAFSDKKYLKIYTESGTPNSLNTSLLLPDESYQLLLYKNQPFERITYSSVIVQKVDAGYAVMGYNTSRPYFEILASRANGVTRTIAVGSATVRVPVEYTNDVIQVPYNYVFTNATAVCDFLLSYGELLKETGLAFETRENGYIMDWSQMAQEFLYWSQQGWSSGSMINLNPSAVKVTTARPQAVVDSIATPSPDNIILNQNRLAINPNNLVIDRIDNTFSITSSTNETINFIDLKFVSYENIVILDNASIFNDLIYDPVTGARQGRVRVSGILSANWTGLVDAPGFVLNQGNIKEWVPNQKYAKGEIVLFKNEYWSASTIIQPSERFDYTVWLKSDYDEVMKGLLPNAANASDQLATSYSIYGANLEQEVDLFSYGLIGFRPREYMQALNLDDISQVGLYQQFLGSKGTTRAAEIFSYADIGKETAQYDIYEYWAMLKSQYGATANRNYVELLLDESKLIADPALIQIINPGDSSQADQQVLLSNIWKSSRRFTSPDVMPTTTTAVTDVGLPTAGYVNLDDVDITVFDIDQPQTINDNLNLLGTGTTVWAAKINPYDWGVYRAKVLPGHIISVSDNLNGRALVQFTSQHGLAVGDLFAIRFFNDIVDGVYRVRAAPSIYSVLIDFVFLSVQSPIVGDGLGFALDSARVKQAADVATLSYSKDLVPGTKVWVDNDGQDLWMVLEKTDVFQEKNNINADPSTDGARFGAAIAQGSRNLSAMIGAPGYNSGAGGVYTYVKDQENRYTQNLEIIEINAIGAAGVGNALDIGNQNWAVVGASNSNSSEGYALTVYNPPSSNVFEKRQLLVAADRGTGGTFEFGHAVSMSQDERWMIVGAPGADKAYIYGRVPVEEQSVEYLTNNVISNYSFAGKIVISDDNQLQVTLDNQLLSLGVDYIVSGDAVVLASEPDNDAVLFIGRKTGIELDLPDLLPLDVSQYLYSVVDSDIYSFTVLVNGIIYRPFIDYRFVAGQILWETLPMVGDRVVIAAASYWKLAKILEGQMTSRFGHSVAMTTDGRQIIVGSSLWGQSNGVTITAGNFSVGFDYQITSVGTTDWISIGAPSNTVGIIFKATAQGSGTGTAVEFVRQGSSYVFDRSVESIEITPATVTNTQFVTVETPADPALVAVKHNGVFLQNASQFINGQFTVSGNTVTLIGVTLAVGDVLEIETNVFRKIQTITSAQPGKDDQFGYSVDQCVNDCSLFIGAPYSSLGTVQAGLVEYYANRCRTYGVINSTIENPVLTPGDYIRINDVYIENTGTTVADLVDDINAAISSGQLSNVLAKVNANGTVQLTVKNFAAAVPQDLIQVLPGPNGAGKLPTDPSLFDDLGFDIYVHQQTIQSPVLQSSAFFGKTIFISDTTSTLVVGAPSGTTIPAVTFDQGRTTFDAHSTGFNDHVVNSGSVYVYDFLPAANPSTANPGQFVFGQQIYDQGLIEKSQGGWVATKEQFGSAIDYTTGVLLIGAPNHDVAADNLSNSGRVSQFWNENLSPAWRTIRHQQPVVDVNLLNTVFMYDRANGAAKQYFDYFDPLQGRILGAARQNIDYIGAVDPAAYNVGDKNNYGQYWAQDHVGQIWWDTNNVRFIDPNQDDVVYTSRRWGQVFPGSTVDVYQWISSAVPPSEYTGPGTPLNNFSYVITSSVNEQGLFITTYFFWVSGVQETSQSAGKTLSIDTIARYIESPRSSGIAYMAPINASTVAIYNGLPYISAKDTVLHVEFDQEYNQDPVHVEYQLIAQDRADGMLTGQLYQKFLDSFCGADMVGHPVPDPFLSPSEKYGVAFRPRQSLFANRFLALQNYLQRANTVLAGYPIVESRDFSLLNSVDKEPPASATYLSYKNEYNGNNTSSLVIPVNYELVKTARIFVNDSLITNYSLATSITGTLVTFSTSYTTSDRIQVEIFSAQWNRRLANYEELTYQDLRLVPVGYRYLVASDSTNGGLWTIYEVTPVGPSALAEVSLTLMLVQNYNTPSYWKYVNWYLAGYDPFVRPQAEVPNYSALDTVSVPVGGTVKVTRNAQSKFEIYQLTTDGWLRVALEDGTIQFLPSLWDYKIGQFGFDAEVFDAQYFDKEPTVETRKIIQAINEELFIGDLAIERNRLLTLMFNYILGEQQAPTWLTKTSLIDVDHTIRQLDQYQIYRRDNQDFVLNYVKEVKPYHVQIREFNLIYKGFDLWQGTSTDFDLPAFWSPEQNMFVSPVLDNGGPPPLSTTSSFVSDAEIWQEFPWNQWFENYLLSVESIIVIDQGINYFGSPTVTVVGDCISPAVLEARVNSRGELFAIEVVDPGYGYVTTPTIEIAGFGTGARAAAVMHNGLVRNISTTIKYDRYQYRSDIVEWQANTIYTQGDRVRYDDRVWQANSTTVGTEFDPTDWAIVPASDLSGVDRTMGYYVPAVNEPGLDLALLISGVDYPGVQVFGLNFDQNTGFDIGNYDVNPYDNLAYGPEGRPTYDPAILDAIYESRFDDPYLGVGPAAIIVDGGAFVDTYSSHAPEELVPGATFDAFDMRVFTTPGSDWQRDGHGFASASTSYEYRPSTVSYSFQGVVDFPIQVRAFNRDQGIQLVSGVDYTIDWPNQQINITSGMSNGDVLLVVCYELGGGNQLYRDIYTGPDAADGIVVPMTYDLIDDVVVFINGTQAFDFDYEQVNTTETRITFDTAPTNEDLVFVTLFGATNDSFLRSWSTPVTEYFNSLGQLTYTLDNSMGGTNPANLIVTKNGIRARPPEGIEYLGNGTRTEFNLPTRGKLSQPSVADNDVAVYVNNDPLVLGRDYTLSPWLGSGTRYVILDRAPSPGSQVLVSVRTNAQYYVVGNQLTFKASGGFVPLLGDVIAVTSFNDTSQQNILTQVFVGPSTTGQQVTQEYDSTDYDSPSTDPYETDPGRFDESVGILVEVNRFDTGRIITDSSRIMVSVNGIWLFENQEFTYTIDGSTVIIAGPPISNSTAVVITSFTQSVLPGPIAFRVFKDMLDFQTSYRITAASSTKLAAPLLATDDIIYVDDVAHLNVPNLEDGIFGQITIDGERIAYREVDAINNTVSSLRRGIAGTGAADHEQGAVVYDIGAGNRLPAKYQDYYETDFWMGDSTTTTFIAENLNLGAWLTPWNENNPYSMGAVVVYVNKYYRAKTNVQPGTELTDLDYWTPLDHAVEIFVGGIKQTSGYSIVGDAPVTIVFDQPPTRGYQVQARLRKGFSWYRPGPVITQGYSDTVFDEASISFTPGSYAFSTNGLPITASDGIALQDQTTDAARFIRGD